MKKIFLFILIFGAVVGTVWFLSGNKAVSQPKVQQVVESVSETVERETKPKTLLPQRLRIEKIGVDAPVESVGQDEKGNMDVPKEDMNTAWYNLGYKPGDNGSAVIAGHFDTKSGAPAVFYNIGKLQAGDPIEVVDENGQTLTFSVVSSVSYNYNEVPLNKVFASTGKPMLNLITCEGTYDQMKQNYSKRLVVYAELAE